MYSEKKTILVTGGAGFIGTNFIRYVLSERPGWKIINLDSLTYAGNPMNFEDIRSQIEGRYEFIHGDIRDRELLGKLIDETILDGVIHFAAESHVDRSISDPFVFIKTNVLGTATLLQVAKEQWQDNLEAYTRREVIKEPA